MRRGGYACGSRQVNGCRFVVADLGLPRLIAGIRIACLPPWARERGWLGSSWRWYLMSGPSSMRRGLVTLRALPDDPENACFHSRRRRIPGNLPRAGHAGPVKAWLARPLAEPGELQRRALSICSQLQITPFWRTFSGSDEGTIHHRTAAVCAPKGTDAIGVLSG
jgi:hypothetical protein